MCVFFCYYGGDCPVALAMFGGLCNYRSHPKDGEGNVFTGVCLLKWGGGGGVPGSPVTSPVIGPVASLVPGLSWSIPLSCP